MMQWPVLLSGIPSKKVGGDIYSIMVQSMGSVEVGPYNQLLKFAKSTKIYIMPVEVHHIVNGEHLDKKLWQYETAPCVVMAKGMHQQYHGRFSETIPEYGGRGTGEELTRSLKLELYHDMFQLQTSWRELWIIAARIITSSVNVPLPRSFVRE